MHRGPYPSVHRAVGAAVAVALVAVGLTGCSKDGPDSALQDFVAGWRAGDLSKVGFVSADGGKIAAPAVLEQIKAVSGELAKQPLTVTAEGEPKTTGDNATSALKLDWTLPGDVKWSYQSTVRLTRQGSDGWRVVWEPTVLHNDLTNGDKFQMSRLRAERASILDAAGKPIVTPRTVIIVGVEPQKVTDLAALRAGLAAQFKKIGVTVDTANLGDRVKNADPGAFLDLITLREPDYNKIRPGLRALNGTVFLKEDRNLAPTRAFARALLGTVDAATAEDLEKNPQTLVQGDTVGHGGLQQKYDSTLRGTAGISVTVSGGTDGEEEQTPKKVFTTAPVAGKPVKTTIDVKTQLAADQALAGEKQPSSLVAIKVSDSSVLAVANGPDGGTVNTALTGQVAPGSTFKAISAYGILQRKVATADATVACPKNAVVSGRSFKNSHDEALGNVPFHVAFAKSCNTAFVGLAPKLGADGLRSASDALGLGGKWDLGIDAFSGKLSPADSPTELAAATFGQGATAVSPLAMASATASIARGQFKQPRLVLDPAPAAPAADGAALDQPAVTALRKMMREVVTAGTATALRGTPGGPVFGKTGTAEFSEDTEDTHSWFIGYQGDVAFAVMVQKGGAGSEAAVPIVSRFLRNLATN
ncbi:penicillin-binding transpeptidase domain-containing protein [Paractinoplanes brasiliensis]|uniref:Cell division protein FtsI/penicillin-binding protein 2 n=1 Tax=Paractinoplanes brasiliensis TaxID=52695 RepID=A0A4R6K099_9ACTN|nr:penicillin-binding transpeptidase domain-containing protein [Actinoplanes brasiliensis]TDO40545.1 cell division protein FtsI/penicillin-binding protein 2 [Actinoplanes brasiliensis]GID25615.1 cell division protein FtsI [Actinoplanes brasiliensis]